MLNYYHLSPESSSNTWRAIGFTSGLLFLGLNNPSTRSIFFLLFYNQISNGLWSQPKANAELGNGTLAPPFLRFLQRLQSTRSPEISRVPALVMFLHLGIANSSSGGILWIFDWPPSPTYCQSALEDTLSLDSSLINLAPISMGLCNLMEEKWPPQSLLPLLQPPSGSYSVYKNNL